MKRIGNLWEKIISVENLMMADEKARKGKTRSYGVRLHDRNRAANIQKLHDDMAAKRFRTSNYHIFTIHEPKERKIYQLPYYPDRIVHHAVMNVMESIWVSSFTADTYSCIKNRGIHLAAKKVRRALKEDPDGTRYCLKIDIRKFYPSIDHEILKGIIRRKIKDNDLLWLLDEIIDSADGVPIGNYLSQYFANVYLMYFDHWMKEVKRVKYYYRYADDIVVFGPEKAALHTLLNEMREYLRDNLKLTVKRNFQVFPVESRGVDFLGFRFYHTHTLIRKGIKRNLCRRVAHIVRLMSKYKIKWMKIKRNIASWWGWLKYSDSKHLCQTLFIQLPYEVNFRR